MTLRAILILIGLLAPALLRAGGITVAAASDLKFALDGIVAEFQAAHPGDRVEVVYGSSGKFAAQIRNGAPFDLYFSADIAYPRLLEREGLTAGPARAYAFGRLVLWSLGAQPQELRDLAAPAYRRIAIANPLHAPYGARAREALERAGVWAAVEPRLVYGENIAQAAQFVESGAADAGIVALSLVLGPNLRDQGRWILVPEALHSPLEQGYVVLRRAGDDPLARRFAEHMSGPAARAALERYGFALPGAR